MRRLNEMFYIEGEQLIKTGNGEPVPEDEPLSFSADEMNLPGGLFGSTWLCPGKSNVIEVELLLWT